MKSKMFFAVLAMTVLCISPALADHHDGGYDKKSGDEMGMGPIGPPEQMKELTWLAGNWDVSMKYKMDPAADWIEATASAKCKEVLGGGALHMTFEGDMMGMPMTGYYLTTYDREENRYEGMWIDNFACRMSLSHGQMKDGKLVLEGKDLHMGNEMYMKYTTTKVSDDKHTWVMQMSMDGENWFDGMEMTYTRSSEAR